MKHSSMPTSRLKQHLAYSKEETLVNANQSVKAIFGLQQRGNTRQGQPDVTICVILPVNILYV